MLKVIYYVGLNDKDTKKQELKITEAKAITSQLVGDCTIQEAEGIFTHEDNTTVNEKTLIITKITDKGLEVVSNEIKYNTSRLKALLNQECIMVEVQESYIQFI